MPSETWFTVSIPQAFIEKCKEGGKEGGREGRKEGGKEGRKEGRSRTEGNAIRIISGHKEFLASYLL